MCVIENPKLNPGLLWETITHIPKAPVSSFTQLSPPDWSPMCLPFIFPHAGSCCSFFQEDLGNWHGQGPESSTPEVRIPAIPLASHQTGSQSPHLESGRIAWPHQFDESVVQSAGP